MIKHQMNDLIIRFKKKINETKTTNQLRNLITLSIAPFILFFVRSPLSLHVQLFRRGGGRARQTSS